MARQGSGEESSKPEDGVVNKSTPMTHHDCSPETFGCARNKFCTWYTKVDITFSCPRGPSESRRFAGIGPCLRGGWIRSGLARHRWRSTGTQPR